MGEQSVDVVIPAYNEEQILECNTRILHDFLRTQCPVPWTISIVSNASTDDTVAIGTRLTQQLKNVRFTHIPDVGKARAIRHGWNASTASIVGFMDADLDTGLDAFLPCIQPILDGTAAMSIGNRYDKRSRVDRGAGRKLLSQGYNILIRAFFPSSRVQDAHCGFKFLRADVAQELLRKTRSNAWFFDTELLVHAQRAGYRIAQVPVQWVDDCERKSRVHVPRIIAEYMTNLAKLRWRLWSRR